MDERSDGGKKLEMGGLTEQEVGLDDENWKQKPRHTDKPARQNVNLNNLISYWFL